MSAREIFVPFLKQLAGSTAGLLLCIAAVQARAAEPATRVENLRLADGAQQRVLIVKPEKVSGAIVMLPGGAGEIGLSVSGAIAHGDNFTVRTRSLWTQRGYAVLIPDAIDHHSLRGERSSAFYADVVARLVELAHQETNGPVFLLGTSQGSIAAVNGAAHLGDKISGVVLTESVSQRGGSGETVFDAMPETVSAPALIVANQQDTCPVSPPEDAERIAMAMTHAASVRVLHVDGGEAGTRDCGSLSPHGYLGIEPEVVSAIADWMAAK